jgi:hypothetical protein
VLRYRDRDAELRAKMWLFPVLSILTIVAMLAILVPTYLDDELRSQLMLSFAVERCGHRAVLREQAVHRPSPGDGVGRRRLAGARAEKQTQ